MEKKKFAIGLWQCHCRNKEVKKKIFWQLWQSHCRKWEGKKKWFLKSGEELKKNASSTIFLQHFHNKLQVIRYY